MDNITMEGVLSLVSALTGVKKQELVSSTDGQEFSDLKELESVIKPITKQHQDELTKKHFRKGVTKAERTIKEVFPDLASNKVEDIAVELQELTNKPVTKEKTEITQKDIVKFLSTDAGKSYVEQSNKEYAQQELASFKFKNKLVQQAVSLIEEKGGTWSKDQARKERQIKILEQALDNYKFKETENGFLPVDEDGEQLIKGNTLVDFEETIISLSPVDFADTTQQPNVKQPTLPTAREVLSGKVTSNFGYSAEEMKNFTAEDIYKAQESGDMEKMAFIRQTMSEQQKIE